MDEHAPLVPPPLTQALTHFAGLIHIALALGPAVGVGARVGRIGENHVDRVVGGGYPLDLGGWEAAVRKREILLQEPEPGLACGAELEEALEDGADGVDDRLIGVQEYLAVTVSPGESDRQAPS